MKQSVIDYYRERGYKGGRKWSYGLCRADGMDEQEALIEVARAYGHDVRRQPVPTWLVELCLDLPPEDPRELERQARLGTIR